MRPEYSEHRRQLIEAGANLGDIVSHDRMMSFATLLYNQMEGSIGKQDLERNRVEIAEAIVGEERERTW